MIPWRGVGRRSPFRRVSCAILAGMVPLLCLSTEAQQHTPETRTLIVGGGFDMPPYDYLDEKGEPKGYNVALAEAVGKVLDMEVVIRPSTWKAARESLQRGEIDVIMGMAYTAERTAQYAFSPPHETVENALFVRKDDEHVRSPGDLAAAEIIVVHGDIMEEWAITQGYSEKLFRVDTQADALRLLAAGNHDCALLPRLPGLYLMRDLTLSNLMTVGPPLLSFDYCVAVRKDNTALLHRITEALDVLRQTGAYARINNDWLEMYETNDYRMDRVLQVLRGVLLAAVIFLVIVAGWIWLLRRQVARRTAALRSENEERERIARALRESETRFRQVTENINDIFWLAEITEPPKMLYMNPAFERIAGIPMETLVANPLLWFDIIHPQDREEAIAYYMAIPEGHGHQEKVFRIVRPDGEIRWLHVRAVVVPAENDGPMRIAGVAQDITKQVETNEALACKEARLRTITTHAPVGIYEVSREGLVLYSNFEIDPVLNQSPLGKAITSWLPEEEREAGREVLERVFTEGVRQSYECSVYRADGQRNTLLARAAPIEHDGQISGAVIIANDITKRTNAETTLAAREAEYRSLVENIQDVIMRFEHDGRIAYVSPASMRVFGITPAELVGRNLAEVSVFASNASACEGAIAGVKNGQESEALEFTVSLGKREVMLSWRFFPELDESRDIAGVMCTVRDVTAQRHLELRLLQEQKLDSLGALAGGVAHDFNNIMMIIIGNTEMVIDELPPNSPNRAMLAEVDRGARRAAELAHQMLAYSGRSASIRQRLDLNEFLEKATPLLRAALPTSAALLTDHAKTPLLIEGDAHQLRQLLINVITNAGEALPAGRGTVHLRAKKRVCSLEALQSPFAVGQVPAGEYACLEIADNGCGIAPDDYPRLFDPFYTTKFTGRGLGLAAVLGIMRMHRGVVQVDTVPGEGSIFRFFLPLAVEDKQAAAPERQKPRVLIVDDEETVLRVAARLLGMAGFVVHTARSGKEALERIAENRDPYSAVVLDYSMPEMNGKEVLSEIAGLQPGVPVIMTSGYPEETIRTEVGDLVCAGFIHKPFRGADLTEAVRRCINQSAGAPDEGAAS